jgi:hypothetical protein
VLAEAGQDPNLVTLAVEEPGEGIAATLATHPRRADRRLHRLQRVRQLAGANARQAVVYTEKAGLNTVIVDSTDDYKGMLRNLAFSLSLYSGQMCTTPQNLLVPRRHRDRRRPPQRGRVRRRPGRRARQAARRPKRAVGTLGAIVNDGVLARLTEAGSGRTWSTVLGRGADEQYPEATIRTPVVVRLDAPTKSPTPASGSARCRSSSPPTPPGTAWRSSSRRCGTARRADRLGLLDLAGGAGGGPRGRARRRRAPVGKPHRRRLRQPDRRVQRPARRGANPAATASLTDSHFVTGRFFTLQSRHHVTEESSNA